MRVIIEYPSYNEKRYSKPWVAKVLAWPIGVRPIFKFGEFVGEHGNAGYVEIDAEPGDVIATGQKDYRGNNTDREFYVVQDGGVVNGEPLSTRAAREMFLRKEHT